MMYGFNKSMYTPMNAPLHVRRRWAHMGAKVRRRTAPLHREIRNLEASLSGCLAQVRGLSRGGDIERPTRGVVPRQRLGFPSSGEYLRHLEKAANPELLVVKNPGHGNDDELRQYVKKWTRNKGGGTVRRRRGRKRGKNLPLTVRIGGKKHTWRALVKKHGVKGAKKYWRGKKKFHGYTRARVGNRRRRSRGRRRNSWRGHKAAHRRAARKGWRGRRRGRRKSRKHARRGKKFVRVGACRYSYRGLLRKFGRKKARKYWRKKKIGGRRSKRRKFRRKKKK